MKKISVAAAFVCLVFLAAMQASSRNSPADVSGEWTIKLTFLMGKATHTAVIEQDGEQLSGTYKGEFLEGRLKGRIEENEITFSSRVRNESTGVTFRYSGTVDGNTMKGKVDMGEYWTADFTAEKKK
ncbi:MAG: hypothetical protein J7M24_03345 [Candidatus Latescibacteria bacterium]|nr:hypothetical protein [Candidatus Latescibacterota bacterium]